MRSIPVYEANLSFGSFGTHNALRIHGEISSTKTSGISSIIANNDELRFVSSRENGVNHLHPWSARSIGAGGGEFVLHFRSKCESETMIICVAKQTSTDAHEHLKRMRNQSEISNDSV